jgi:hypothetical protein
VFGTVSNDLEMKWKFWKSRKKNARCISEKFERTWQMIA